MKIANSKNQYLKFCGGLDLNSVSKKLKSRLTIPSSSILQIYKYWATRRIRMRGIPLLKQFRPEYINGTIIIPKSSNEILRNVSKLKHIRAELEKYRSVIDLILKREKIKRQLAMNTRDKFENLFKRDISHCREVLNLLNEINNSSDDNSSDNTIVLNLKNHINDSNINLNSITNKLNNNNYKNKDEFMHDIQIVYTALKNSKFNNRKNNIKEMEKIENIILEYEKMHPINHKINGKNSHSQENGHFKKKKKKKKIRKKKQKKKMQINNKPKNKK